MIGPDALVVAPTLALAVAAGLVAHEWSHALALRLAGVEYVVEYFPDRSDGLVGVLASCPWAVVRPRPTGREAPWTLRVAALMPLLLTLPLLALGAIGSLPSSDHLVATAAIIGWLACAVPSPQDFSVAFYAHRALEVVDDREDADAVVRPSRAD